MMAPQVIIEPKELMSVPEGKSMTKFNTNNDNNHNMSQNSFDNALKETSNHYENNRDESDEEDYEKTPVKCSAIHTLERDMPDFDYSNLVVELRERILDYSRQNPGMFSGKELDKCRQDDWYLSRYLLRHKLDVDAAFVMLKKSMRFKTESLCHSIRVEDFPAEFYQVGGVFGYEPDRKGNLMLYIRVKIHRKIPEIAAVFQAFLYYNIERLDEAAKGRGISIVFDCTGAGLANADMDILFMLISTLINYFPKGFSYLLVHELPWILKPFWHIAKAWVPEEHRQLVKFSNSRTIYEYVERQNLPDFMGGTCKRDYLSPPTNCTTLEEAAKLWGVGRDVIKRILIKFSEYLPPETMERFLSNEDPEEFNDAQEELMKDRELEDCVTSQHNDENQENKPLD